MLLWQPMAPLNHIFPKHAHGTKCLDTVTQWQFYSATTHKTSWQTKQRYNTTHVKDQHTNWPFTNTQWKYNQTTTVQSHSLHVPLQKLSKDPNNTKWQVSPLSRQATKTGHLAGIRSIHGHKKATECSTAAAALLQLINSGQKLVPNQLLVR